MVNDAPVIVVRRKKVVAGQGHGAAWKIAFADFAIAMMAFFLVLWLTESTSLEEQKAISGYFKDPVGFKEGGQKYIIDLGGSGDKVVDRNSTVTVSKEDAEKIIDSETVEALAHEIEIKRFEQLADDIREIIRSNETLVPYEQQIDLTVTKEGLQIQIMDQESRPMFDSGSDEIKVHAEAILKALAKTIGTLPNSISISGHTDASGFSARRRYSNWELSADRANAARRVLQANGVREEQVIRVVGKGSSALYLPEDPFNPINRRISILVLSLKREEGLTELFKGMQKDNVKVTDFEGEFGNKGESESSTGNPGGVSTPEKASGVNALIQESVPNFDFDTLFDEPVGNAEKADEAINQENRKAQQNIFEVPSTPRQSDAIDDPGVSTPAVPEKPEKDIFLDFDTTEINQQSKTPVTQKKAAAGPSASAPSTLSTPSPSASTPSTPSETAVPEEKEKPWWEN